MADGLTAAGLRDAVARQGWTCGFARIHRLAALQEDAARLPLLGADPDVIRERLGFYEFRPPASLPDAASIIVVAVPLPVVRVSFACAGRRVSVTVPPGYIGFDAAGRAVQAFLERSLAAAAGHLAPVLLPEKALATRIGLAAYGRNNLCYVPGMGSMLRLATFFTDLELEEDPWSAPRELARCASCRSCGRACPTAAIRSDRFLLATDRCLVLHNERPAEIPFPDWIPASAHACLVGCLSCQAACPENAGHLGRIEEGGEFTDEETAVLLDGAPVASLSAGLREKLDRCDLTALHGVLSRNLRAALARAASCGRTGSGR